MVTKVVIFKIQSQLVSPFLALNVERGIYGLEKVKNMEVREGLEQFMKNKHFKKIIDKTFENN